MTASESNDSAQLEEAPRVAHFMVAVNSVVLQRTEPVLLVNAFQNETQTRMHRPAKINLQQMTE